jgi:hypothetical protein
MMERERDRERERERGRERGREREVDTKVTKHSVSIRRGACMRMCGMR